MYGMEGGMFGGGPVMWVVWILLVIVIVGVVRAMTNMSSSDDRPTPMEILEQRYARGEIDDEEYRHRRRELGG